MKIQERHLRGVSSFIIKKYEELGKDKEFMEKKRQRIASWMLVVILVVSLFTGMGQQADAAGYQIIGGDKLISSGIDGLNNHGGETFMYYLSIGGNEAFCTEIGNHKITGNYQVKNVNYGAYERYIKGAVYYRNISAEEYSTNDKIKKYKAAQLLIWRCMQLKESKITPNKSNILNSVLQKTITANCGKDVWNDITKVVQNSVNQEYDAFVTLTSYAHTGSQSVLTGTAKKGACSASMTKTVKYVGADAHLEATYGIYTTSDKKVAQIVTGSNGSGSTKEVLLAHTKYYAKEITPPTGASLSSKKYEFTTGAIGSRTPISKNAIEDEPLSLEIRVRKVSEKDRTIKIPGVEFTIYEYSQSATDKAKEKAKKEGKPQTVIDQIKEFVVISEKHVENKKKVIVTDKDGNATTSKLYETKDNKGKFKLVETKPAEGYLLGDGWSVTAITKEEYPERILNYTVTNQEEEIYGDVEVEKLDRENATEKIPDTTFEILEWNGTAYVHHSNITTNEKGWAKSGLLHVSDTNQGKYQVIENRANPRYVLDTGWKKEFVITKQTKHFTYSVTNEKKKGKIQLTKESVNPTSLVRVPDSYEGVTYTLYKTYEIKGNLAIGKEVVQNGIISLNKKGEGFAKDIEIGTYLLMETKANPHFIWDESCITSATNTMLVTIRENQTAYLHARKGISYDDGKTFQPVKNGLGKEVSRTESDYHKYMENALLNLQKWMKVKVKKTLPDGKPLAGAEFEISQWSEKTKNYVAQKTKYVSLADGSVKDASSGREIMLPYTEDNKGKFAIRETRQPAGCETPKFYEKFSFADAKLSEDHTCYVYQKDVNNEPGSYQLRIYKEDSKTKKPISQAEFSLYEADGKKKVGTFTEEKEGIYTYTVKGVYLGKGESKKYVIRETKIPDKYVEFSDTEKNYKKEIVIHCDETPDEIRVAEQPVLGRIYGKKVDAETKDGKAQGDASLKGARYGLYTNAKCQGLPERIAITEEDGSFLFDALELKNYYVREITASEKGYLLSSEIEKAFLYDAYSKTKKKDIELVTLSVTSKEQVKKGNVIWKKYGQTSQEQLTGKKNPLANAGFRVYRIGNLRAQKDEKKDDFSTYDFKGEKPEIVGKNGETEVFTNEKGEGKIENLAYGKYVLAETSVPEYYQAVKPVVFEITEQGQTIDLGEMIDEKLCVPVEIEKYDALTKERIPKAGVGFKVFDVKKNAYVQEEKEVEENGIKKKILSDKVYYTNQEGKAVTDPLPRSEYRFEECEAPEGYLMDAQPVTLQIAYGMPEIQKDEQGNARIQIRFEDTPLRVQIHKYKEGTKKQMEGAVLQILDSNGKIFKEFTTGKEAEMISQIPKGEYILREKEAPEGFEKADDLAFTVKEVKEIQNIVLEDRPVIELEKAEEAPEDVPQETKVKGAHREYDYDDSLKEAAKTGDDQKLFGYLMMTVFLGCSMVLWTVYEKKKTKKAQEEKKK